MTTKRIATSIVGILLIFAIVAMAWTRQVAPVSAGFLPTDTPVLTTVASTATSIPPTQAPPTATSVPATPTPVPATATTTGPKAGPNAGPKAGPPATPTPVPTTVTTHPLTTTSILLLGTPEMPVTGGQVSEPTENTNIALFQAGALLAGVLALLIVVIRRSAKSKKEAANVTHV